MAMFAVPNIQSVRWGGETTAAASGAITARYWRAKLVGSGLQDHTAFAQFVPTWGLGSSAATLSASETGAGDVANLSDGSQTTKWETTAAYTIAYLSMDLGAGKSDTLIALSLQQTNEADAVSAHPAALIVQWSNVGGATEEDWVDYCVLLTQVSGVSSDLVQYDVTADAQQGNDFFLNSDNDYWGFIVINPTNGAKLAEVEWQNAAGTGIGTVSSHITKSATLTPANLYDVNTGTESTFESQPHPQLVSTLFSAAIAPVQVELTGSATAADSWENFYIIAGPDAICQQIVTEIDRTWTNSEVVVVQPRMPKLVQNAVIHYRLEDIANDQWDDSIAFGGVARHLAQAVSGKRGTVNTSPARITFDNTGTTQYMEALFSSVSVRSVIALFRREEEYWEGQSDTSGAAGVGELKVSGATGSSDLLGRYEGLFTDSETFFVDGSGWGINPLVTGIPQQTWAAMIGTDSAASSIYDVAIARFVSGYGSCSWAELVFLGDVDITKNGPQKQLQKYIERVIDAAEAA